MFVLHTRSGTVLKDIGCRVCQTWLWGCYPSWNTVAGAGNRGLFNDAIEVDKVPIAFPLALGHAQMQVIRPKEANVANPPILRLNK